jgi:hypothetical protein
MDQRSPDEIRASESRYKVFLAAAIVIAIVLIGITNLLNAYINGNKMYYSGFALGKQNGYTSGYNIGQADTLSANSYKLFDSELIGDTVKTPTDPYKSKNGWMYRAYVADQINDPTVDMPDVSCDASKSIIIRGFDIGTNICKDTRFNATLLNSLVGKSKPIPFNEKLIEKNTMHTPQCMRDPQVQKDSVLQFQYKCAAPDEFGTWDKENKWTEALKFINK